jgi:polypyrimidine tract-binding protein 1
MDSLDYRKRKEGEFHQNQAPHQQPTIQQHMYNNQPQQAGSMDNGAKKFKQENPPSKVVHLRNLPLPNNNNFPQHEDLEGEVIKMGFKFGGIKDLLMMRKSGQAFLEMDTLEIAMKFVDTYRDDPPNIGRHTIYIQYSKHKELSNVDNNQQQQQLRERLKEARSGNFSTRTNNYTQNYHNRSSNRNFNSEHGNNYANRDHQAPASINHGGSGDFNNRIRDNNANDGASNNLNHESRRVLHVVIEKEKFPVTIHQFCDLFKRHGVVQRIVMFKKSGDRGQRSSQQVLIEMKDPVAAQSAQNAFNGANIYDGCNIMRIDFSNLPHLQVKSDTDQRWDYTRSPKPENNLLPYQTQHQQGTGDNRMSLNSSGPGGTHPITGAPQPATQGAVNHFNTGYGNNQSMNYYGNPQQFPPFGVQAPTMNAPPIQQYQPPPPMGAPGGQTFQGYDSRGNPSGPGGMHDPLRINHGGMAMHQPPFPTGGYAESNASPVLCVSNLPMPASATNSSGSQIKDADIKDITPYDLFILFGVYGDVHRVKILFEKRDSALIEFATPHQASIALKYLNNQKLRGREMKLKLSKYQKVNLPKDKTQDTHNLTEDYTNHHLHRFRKQGSKNYQNIYQPSDVLHLSNIPDGTSETQLTDLFKPHGTVNQFKFFKDPKMALIKMGSIEEAIAALIKTHNHKMSPNQHLRVSFSRGYLTP